jgi:error-prone DNA polymerase
VTAGGAVRVGLGYVVGVRADEVAALVAAREEGGPFRSLEDLASRAGAGRAALERLAWSGACDVLAGGDRRVALWQLGMTAPGLKIAEGTQLALALALPTAPALASLSPWDAMIADYATTGLTATGHPLELLRERLRGEGAIDVGALAHLPHGAPVRIGGLVIARQRPGTAKGITFMLLEDERGTVNVIVSPQIYERDRLEVRTEPLVVVDGRLERHAAAGGAINVLARRVRRLEVGDRMKAQVKDFSLLDAIELARQRREQELAATGTDDFRAVAPPVMNFGSGRRR